MTYAELQVASNFSFLRGASHAEELVGQAVELGVSAIAVTDRNSVAGVVRAHRAAKNAGLQLVVGVRLDFQDETSVLCYPTNRAAYGRLARLLTLGKRRAPKGECWITQEDFFAYAEGMMAVVLPFAPLDDPGHSRWQRRRWRWMRRLREHVRRHQREPAGADLSGGEFSLPGRRQRCACACSRR